MSYNEAPEEYTDDTRPAVGASELKAMLDFLANVANKDNWGYFDPSGCPKGMGRYKDSWIGDGEHPLDAAERLLATMKSNGLMSRPATKD